MKKASILGMLKISVDQMKEMINGLLASAKEKKKIKEPVNLFNLCHEVINMLKPSPNFEIFIKHDLPTVKSHRTSLKQVLQNIVGNALKFNDKTKPVIKIGCKEEKNCYVIGVNDNGMGISPDMVNTIFDSYSIGHQDEKIESHGLGLSISKQLVEELGGKIWVESILGQKTTFSFTISK